MAVVHTRRKPRGTSFGLVVAAVLFYICYRWQDGVTWWMLVGGIVISFAVDGLVHKSVDREDVYIEDKL